MSIAAHIVHVAKRNKSIALRKGPKGRYSTERKAVTARRELIRRLWRACGDVGQVARLIGMERDRVRELIRGAGW